MYCAQCGKQIPDDAAFCSACGVKTNSGTAPSSGSSAGSVTGAMSDFQGMKSMRIASIACSVVILLLLFTKLFHIQIPMYGSRDCSVFDLLSLFSKFEDLCSNLGVDSVAGSLLVFILFIVLAATLGTFIFTARYIYREWSWSPETRNNYHILAGYSGMSGTMIALMILYVCLFFLNMYFESQADFYSVSFGIAYTGNTYIIFALAAVNRIFILPKYNEIYYKYGKAMAEQFREMEEKQREADQKAYDEEMLSKGGWRCEGCGTVNPHYTGMCSCGTHRDYQN